MRQIGRVKGWEGESGMERERNRERERKREREIEREKKKERERKIKIGDMRENVGEIYIYMILYLRCTE